MGTSCSFRYLICILLENLECQMYVHVLPEDMKLIWDWPHNLKQN